MAALLLPAGTPTFAQPPPEADTAGTGGATLLGRVRSDLTGKPIPFAHVLADAGPPGPSYRALADSLGRYRLAGLAPGAYDLVVSAEGFATLRVAGVILVGRGREERDVELLQGVVELANRRVKVSAAGRFRGMANSSRGMDGEEIRRAPGALMDVQRVIQKFPGVQARGDNVNEVVARGGFPGENQFLLDNIEIPNPNYFGNQGTGGGVISVVNPLLVKRLVLNTGAPPARYGGKASSVLDITLREGNDESVVGGLDLGFSGTGLLAEGPLWPGATFLSSFRRSYLDAVAEFEPSTAVPRFWGGQAKATQKAGRGKVSVSGLLGRSGIAIRDAEADFGTEGDVLEAGGDVFAAGATWTAPAGEDVDLSATLSLAGNAIMRKRYYAEEGGGAPRSERRSEELEGTFKAEAVRYIVRGRGRLALGGEARRASLRDRSRGREDTLRAYAGPGDSVGVPVPSASGGPVTGWIPPGADLEADRGAAYVSADLPLGSRFAAGLGLRLERFGLSEDWSLMPRAGLRYGAREDLELSVAGGLMAQPQDLLDHAAREENLALPMKRAWTASVEADWRPDAGLDQVSLNVYAKHYDGLLLDAARAPDSGAAYAFLASPARLADGEAFARGIELFVERKLSGGAFASLAWSLSRSETRFAALDGGAWHPSDFDYPHVINVTGGAARSLLAHAWYRSLRGKAWFQALCWLIPLGDRVEGSFRLRHASGRPYTPLAYDAGVRRWAYPAGAANSARYPDYLSLDLRFERRIGYGPLRMMFYFDFQNVLARKNVFTYVWNDRTGERTTVYQLPFFPVGGFIIGF